MNNIEKKYVVLDVETNGLSSIYDDLLSISIYKPDDKKIWNRFLPLEKASNVYTTHINGITSEDLKDKFPLSQEELNDVIKKFELENRTILTFGNIDEKFIKNYLKRKKLKGYDLMTFYNFKHDIISSRFSEGNITKDNLCILYGIENIQKIHTGINDCILEWELFKKLNGNKLLITNNNVFEFNNDYIIPASYLATYPNFKYCFTDFPKISCTVKTIKKFPIVTKGIQKFVNNISGITIEHLINTLLEVDKIDSKEFLIQNKKKLKYIGRLPSKYDEIPILLNSDGTISAIRKEDKLLVDEINKSTEILKSRIVPITDFIKQKIFKNDKILSQELVLSKDKKVLALCDLSNSNSILEIKTFNPKIENNKYQFYYESNGRKCYILTIDWFGSKKYIDFIISEISFELVQKKERIKPEKKEKELLSETDYSILLEKNNFSLVNYISSNDIIKIKCNFCNSTFDTTYSYGQRIKKCPLCHGKVSLSDEEKIQKRAEKFYEKIKIKSNNSIIASNYIESRKPVKAKCSKCGNEWYLRADHLLDRCFCPKCKFNK